MFTILQLSKAKKKMNELWNFSFWQIYLVYSERSNYDIRIKNDYVIQWKFTRH